MNLGRKLIILTVDVNKEISSNMAMQVVSPGGKISYSSKKSGLLPNQGGEVTQNQTIFLNKGFFRDHIGPF